MAARVVTTLLTALDGLQSAHPLRPAQRAAWIV
jgi:hypothetical protein